MFSQVVGQQDIQTRLLQEVQAGRIPHALLLAGPPGCGKLALAVALAQYLLCHRPGEHDACGQCPSCRLSVHFAHPDLHFVFPVVRYKNAESSVSDIYMDVWRTRLQSGLYFGLEDWLEDMKAGAGQQALIYAAEATQIQRKLALKPAMGGRKTLLMWLPEKMNAECANKLLKLMEEPPEGTHFLLVSNEPEKMLPTILSRVQRIDVKAVDADSMTKALQALHPGEETTAAVRNAQGNYTAALKAMDTQKDLSLFLDLFILLMRLAYMRKIKEMHKWSEQMAGMGRERQKDFLTYSQKLIRENFIYNFHQPALNYMTTQEAGFAANFARFVNERNVTGIMEELALAQRDIEQNVNPKFVFFDLALKMIVLLIQ